MYHAATAVSAAPHFRLISVTIDPRLFRGKHLSFIGQILVDTWDRKFALLVHSIHAVKNTSHSNCLIEHVSMGQKSPPFKVLHTTLGSHLTKAFTKHNDS